LEEPITYKLAEERVEPLVRLSTSGPALLKVEVRTASLLERINRFVVLAETHLGQIRLYLRNTGRLRDLIQRGSTALFIPNKRVKTDGLLIGVMIDEVRAAIVDPILQISAFEEAWRRGLIPWLEGWRIAKREYNFEDSRIDYFIVKDRSRGLLEAKSAVYHSEDNYCMYPDTVSTRGRRHVEALIRARNKHYQSFIVFISAHPLCRRFKPCSEADPLLRALLLKARRLGVKLYSLKMHLKVDGEIVLDSPSIPVML